MNYCALDDAFQNIGGAPSPGCSADYATKMARKEERRKARRCKGPAAEYLDIEDKDPDRQTFHKLPDVPAMNPATGLREHVPVTAPQGTTEAFSTHINSQDPNNQQVRNFDKDPLHDYLEDEMEKRLVPVRAPSNEIFKPTGYVGKPKGYFGKDPDSDSFADYEPDATNETLYPDFRKTFEQAGVARAGSSTSLPTPSVNMYWKPVTAAGAQTSFVEHLPPPGGKYHQRPLNGEVSMDQVMKKLDKLFARLDDMNSSSPEQVTSELLMFISSGIFVLFMMDLLVKRGSKLRF
jgi:hypothetical protein